MADELKSGWIWSFTCFNWWSNTPWNPVLNASSTLLLLYSESLYEYNDFRPIALTSVNMKSLENIMVKHLKTDIWGGIKTHSSLHTKKGRSTEDVVVTLVHILSKHLDEPKTYASSLFLNFSSTFNTIQPDILLSKIITFQINPYLIHWYFFLSHKQGSASQGKWHTILLKYHQCWSTLGLY